ncbi:hypothetical protein [Hymenobacter jeollabukensis]|uniref:HTH Mu-type domain-containing protein n=1 Tax=Hymenobacter jeollabukensis TaxID=2025313 RepID=A0A5R8WLX0_9BACT|nr:hypothetical protein [Hymenobacter jeollabukensis]TLM89958.1 hypothetical protein FDY95_18205 [Hymenobacter jeollabukensis]
MISHFLNNPFANSQLSHRRFAQYAQVHLERLRAKDAQDALLEPTETALKALQEAVKANATSKAKGQGKRLSNDAAMKNLLKFISRKAGVIADTFSQDGAVRGEDTPGYRAFYPQGVTEYRRAGKDGLETLAARFANVADEHAATVGAKLAKDVRALLQDVADSRQSQLLESGTTKDSSTQGQQERVALAEQLFVNLLTLLLRHKAHPEAAGDYFNQGLLGARTHATAAEKQAAALPGVPALAVN